MCTKNAIIHIGLPKTATTAIQHNILQPANSISNLGNPSSSSNKDLKALKYYIMQAGKNDFYENYSKICSFIENNIEDNTTPVLSREGVSVANLDPLTNSSISREEIADRIKLLFPEAKILLTTRNQIDFLKSFYKESYKRRCTNKTFKTWIREALYNESFKYRLDICSIYSLSKIYIDRFGQNSLKIIPYEEICEDGIDNFLKWLSCNSNDSVENYRALWEQRGEHNTATTRVELFIADAVYGSNYLKHIANILPKHDIKRIIRRITDINCALPSDKEQKDLHDYYSNENKIIENYFSLNLKRYGYP